MTLREYEEKAELYYKIFATADVLHARLSGIEHHGPVGVNPINNALNALDKQTVDFADFLSEKHIIPIDAYSSSIENMKLLRPMLFARARNELIHIPTEKGNKLASAFEKNWNQIIEADKLVKRINWTSAELEKLGEGVCLHGLSTENEESKLLLEAVRASAKQTNFFEGLVDVTLLVARKSRELDLSFKPQDIGRAALYRSFKNDQSFITIQTPETPATAIIAYHELHTHAAYGADAVLAGISLAARNHPEGIQQRQIVEEATQILASEDVWKPEKQVKDAAKELTDRFKPRKNSRQNKIPLADGPYGFETIQDKLSKSRENAFSLTAWGAIALLQAACCEECFDRKWLSATLTAYGHVFSSYTFLQELEALNPNSTIKKWIERTTERIIEQHEDVARSKGPYAAKIVRKDAIVYCVDEPTDYSKNRGRLDIAIAWISDAGLVRRDGSEYRLHEVS
jgi:hypothetical protein